MKKLSLICMGLVLLMAMTQCKKAETPSTNDNEGEKVHITLEVDNGSKNFVHPETGNAFFTNGDKVLVANGGRYVGTLTYNSSNRRFTGSVTGADESDYLHFYFMGNQPLDVDTVSNRPTSFTVNISDQTNCYPQIAYNHSTAFYSESVTSYKAQLLNQCALVKFTTDEIPVETVVTVCGLNNQVSVNLVNNSFSFSQADGGIKLHAESTTSRWAILLPQTIETTPTVTIPGYVSSMSLTTPMVIENNGYITSGITITPPLFTINYSGAKVQFSSGNLQYNAVSGAWRFAENQYDVCQPQDGTWNTSGWVDLFGWGTWTGNNPNPLNTSMNYEDYLWNGNDFQKDLQNASGTWRTLNRDEWSHLLYERIGAFNIKYAKAKINDVNGLIIFPDNPDHEPEAEAIFAGVTIENANEETGSYIDYSESWSVLEAAGCVFLPAAGNRSLDPDGGSSTVVDVAGVNDAGIYWTSPLGHDPIVNEFAYNILFFEPDCTESENYRFVGGSVRLVKDR